MINWRKINKISEDIIKKTEEKLDIIFPKEIYNLILKFNHSRPDRFLFDTSKSKERMLGSLLEFDSDSEHSDNIINVYHSINDRLPINLYPFASDPGGNFICFLLEKKEIQGIYFWNHEQNFSIKDGLIHIQNINKSIESSRIEFISKSLEDFLSNLYFPN